jgi:hypothetical protein
MDENGGTKEDENVRKRVVRERQQKRVGAQEKEGESVRKKRVQA